MIQRTWLKDDLKLITSPGETQSLAEEAISDDSVYLIPAFSGLGAPYWDSHAKAAVVGMTRTTGRAEIVRTAVECIAYQITDIVNAMSEDAGIGAAYAARLTLGVWDEHIFEKMGRKKYKPKMDAKLRNKKFAGWAAAVSAVLSEE